MSRLPTPEVARDRAAPLQRVRQSRARGARRAWTWRLAAASIATCVCLVLVEFAYRVHHALSYGTPVWQSVADLGRDPNLDDHLDPIAIDSRLGWRSASNYRFDGVRTNLDGSSYPVHVAFDAQGWRQYGDTGSPRPKILVIGDSYSQALQVSDAATYYMLLGRSLDAEIFAYGAGGFGTLQEYLVFDQYVDVIRPDVVVWQFCSNDFVNNSFELESRSFINNNSLRRPYLEGDRIVYALPRSDPLGIRSVWGMQSRVVYALLSRWDARQAATHATDSIEIGMRRLGLAEPAFQAAVQTTDRLLGMVRARAGQIPILALSCDDGPPYTAVWEELSARHAITFAPEVARSLLHSPLGPGIWSADHHWNEVGHRLVSEALRPRVAQALSPANAASRP